jgi:hypothetical protein
VKRPKKKDEEEEPYKENITLDITAVRAADCLENIPKIRHFRLFPPLNGRADVPSAVTSR